MPVCACRLPGCGLQREQQFRLHLLELLRGHADGVVVERPRVLRMPGFAGRIGSSPEQRGACLDKGAKLVPVCTHALPKRGLPWQQRRGLLLLKLLHGDADGVVVEQSRVLRVPGSAECSSSSSP